MDRATYHVMPRQGGWAVRLNGKFFGPCPSQTAAVDAAIAAAAVAIENGCRAQVLVQENNLLRTAWDSERGAGRPLRPS
jgi:hypothetical protein